MPTKKITRRWLYNSFLVILIFLSLIIIAFSLAIRSYYYNSVLTVVRNTASVQNASLVNYSEDNTVDFSASVRTLVENFADKDRMELMAIDKNGTVIITSSGFSPSGDLEMPDYEAALSSSTRDAYSYDTLNGESVLAYTLLAPSVDDSNVSALRYVVSLTAVKRQIYMLIAAAGVVGAAIIFFVILSNSYFINSVINPIDEVRKIALQISKGDFSTHLKKTSDDEIGELCDAINAMALELQENEKMKNDFISSVSHELRTPLTAIKGWAETLMDDSVDRETTKKGIGVIIKESDRLSGMVEELLDFSRLQSGRLKLSLTKIDLVAELSDAVLMFTERARQEGIALNYDEPMDILPIMGDSNRLRQVFVNILDNALKYSDAGDSVTVTVQHSENNAIITIRDTGIGIASEDLPKVKTRFYKANATRRGWASGLRSPTRLSRCTAATSRWTARKGKAPPSPSRCRWPADRRADKKAQQKRTLLREGPFFCSGPAQMLWPCSKLQSIHNFCFIFCWPGVTIILFYSRSRPLILTSTFWIKLSSACDCLG